MNILFLSTWYPGMRIRGNGSLPVVYYGARNTLRFMVKHRLYPALARQALGSRACWSLCPKWPHKRALADFAGGQSGGAAWLI